MTAATPVLSGVQTLVRLLALRHELDRRDGLLTATMVSGYPGSPLGGFDLELEQHEPGRHRIVHRPGLNEELAAATVWGSQMGAALPYDEVDGVAGAWYGKGPGLDRSGDVLKHANAMGAGPNGGAVVFCGDDPAAKSSTLACDSQYTFADAGMPVLIPGDQQDVLDFGVHAFRMSRYAGAWVGLKIVTAVADGIGTVDLDPGRHHSVEPRLSIDGQLWEHRPQATIGPHAVPGQEELINELRLRAARAYARDNGLDRTVGPDTAELGIVCSGATYFDLVQALSERGVSPAGLADAGVRILRLGMTYPLVEDTVVEFAASVRRMLVVEEKRPFVETQLRAALHEAGSRIPVLGKRDGGGKPLISSSGVLDPKAIGEIVDRVLPSLRPAPKARLELPLLITPARAPAYCSGCPHNRSTVAPDDALVGGGVGCHGIMYFEARNKNLKTLPPTPMGAEGVPWIGLSPFVNEPHLIQNLGDGTLTHSGTLAIRASVAAGADITFKILYNTAVAMTGGQEVTGQQDVPALTRSLRAEGVREIVVCAEDPGRYGRRAGWADDVQVLGRDRLAEVQQRLRKAPGVTVIIYDQRCAAEARRLRKRGLLPEPPRRVVINEAACEGCGDCGVKSNCLSVLPLDTEFGTKRRIHDSSCNRDYTCLDGDCPSFVTITPKDGGRERARPARKRPELPPGVLPEPARPVVGDRYSIYFTGIGGTGIVTANRILVRAAEAAGWTVGGMDQTGLSQKAGAVVSHLHLAVNRAALSSAAVSGDGADLYLSGDILQAATADHLAKARAGRAMAVVDRTVTPTAAMLQNQAQAPAVAELEAAITEHIGPERATVVDARVLAERVFADHLPANVVLLGAAFQLGGLPVSAADVDSALSGRSGAGNRLAFEWGRWLVHDPEAVAAAVEGDRVAPTARGYEPTATALSTAEDLVAQRDLPAELRERLLRRTAQVVDYQSAGRARRYLDLVEYAAAHDDATRDWSLTRTVVDSWFALLTYKDEYEVARLHLAADYDAVAAELGIDGAYSVTYQLHPPILRRLGMNRKLPAGKPYELAFRALRRMKRLRGTPFDPFGWDRDRRTERAVIAEYAQLITEVVDPAARVSYERQVRLAASASEIRGYAGIKENSVARWRSGIAAWRREHREETVAAPVSDVTGASS
ncbi:putative pyruvate ferredoxin/flavodoxin oxidoreductase [Nocardia nova SH22a]|uniref:Putative pyruvate ferredoxin/flavodoxin oxidoreductase n=1 Tax=Nocardia nova SH22a TaxID=1415166 RepID=W5TPT5_9NOCA|nr:indolepyruvate ferredoxin oxidoreductase family protein [Nocardia nova]AHH20938.1 putative pyruvate ferredoxin/flavodoxin oxidoreductase [Nocardia nova SH22a]